MWKVRSVRAVLLDISGVLKNSKGEEYWAIPGSVEAVNRYVCIRIIKYNSTVIITFAFEAGCCWKQIVEMYKINLSKN